MGGEESPYVGMMYYYGLGGVKRDFRPVNTPNSLIFPIAYRTLLDRDFLRQVQNESGTTITPRGVFQPANSILPPGERKLHLVIEGLERSRITRAKEAILSQAESVRSEYLPNYQHHSTRFQVV